MTAIDNLFAAGEFMILDDAIELNRIRPWLDQSNYADALEALLWWHRQVDTCHIVPTLAPAPADLRRRAA